jgi:stage II sporulation protein D
VTNTTLDQVYKGYAGEAANSNQAADETHGQVVLYQGRLVATFFSSNNGGYVADVSEVWGSSYPYLKAVPDEWSLSGAHANWTQNYAQSEMQSILRQVSGKDVGTLLRLNVAQRGPSGRVTELQVQGTAGTYSLFREGSRLNTTPGNGVSFALRSQLYEVVPNLPVRYAVNGAGEVVELPADLTGVSLQSAGEVTTLPVKTEVSVVGAGGTSALSLVPTGFTFNGHGWGHGIGLSQYGAKAMAEAGYSYSDILTHYYQAITISSEGD